MSRRGLVAGNWKMNGLIGVADSLVGGILDGLAKRAGKSVCEVLVCPPFTAIQSVGKRVGGTAIRLGGQNMSEHKPGAHTGEITGQMLTELGCTYVILGHSERRSMYGEDSALVSRKMASAYRDGLTPIVCVGETLAERESNRTLDVIGEQVSAIFPNLPADEAKRQQLVLAYEPVWAIGTGKTASPEQAQEVHAFIRKMLVDKLGNDTASKVRILYGGSVKPDNASVIFSKPDVDGGLIGGAALKAEDFLGIIDGFPG
ncbi:MAG: Triosephosphate isomerase [Magnetococcales bacterium]|nr:Triosephosphate isomerase [Magnetococcales bacterium]HIJ83440.1 triose-phosphate isomerase [Magnetococcales bacterium]